ncbi:MULTISPECIES: Gfo/Idh/MocA family protein [unclassified Polaribacter]|uniref:Gfo/Idh/MocA family protein n=1 Tax=unclassified Polaribacter TaxID=196858 RepID=UPI0011BD4D40|nr:MULTISPECIES: Gfo/Idh/MocA family oxidoreductase [unclassified Polaribacter]TXD52963.1 Gfo/Idh/MocA family oxidoreductase [Polaribacter sp. IC063]TXD60945.1 Gfo/Idh/MocA family oxidoreductase [Polaribacter sp. IC066]
MKNKTIKWGIIGLGKIADKFATDLATLENAALFAVASRSQENANKFAEKHHAKKAYDSYEALIKDSEVDAIYIATPHSFHKEHSILCLQHKKAVLCEKPFAMNAQEVAEMISVAKENDTLLMEALWTYFLPHFNVVLEIVKSEKYGKLKKLEADFGFFTPYNTKSRVFKKEVGGGSLLDIGIYPIFAALATLGKPNNMEAKATFFENGADASCAMIFEYDDAKAHLKSTLLEETPTEAIFTFEDAVVKLHSRFQEPASISVIKDHKEEVIDLKVTTIGYSFEAEHFSQLIKDGKKQSDVMTFEFSENLIATLDEVRRVIGLEY